MIEETVQETAQETVPKETVHVIALFVAAPGKEDDLAKVLTALVEPTRKEAGCLHYDLFRGFGSSAAFAFKEEWESNEALDVHLQTPHVQQALGQTPDLLGAPVSIERYRKVG